MIPNPWIILAAAIAVAGACWRAYDFGYSNALGDAAKAMQDALASQRAELEAYYADKQTTEVIYRDRVKTITEAADPAGCLDSHVPDGVLSAVRGD